MLKSLWDYRGFILGNVIREFQIKYRNSLLGAAWNVLNPLSMIVVYTVIFSHVMQAKLPGVEGSFAYGVYICSGILVWGFFSEIISRGQNVFLDNANLLKKINFPRLCLPVIVIFNAFVNFGIVFGLFSLFLLLTGYLPGLPYLALPIVLFVLMLFAIGLGITLGVLNVFFRDVGQFFGIVLQFWFWLTPIIYPISILPENIRSYIELNPITGVVSACQSILVHHRWPEWDALIPTAVLGILFCIIGLWLYKKHVGEMIDEL